MDIKKELVSFKQRLDPEIEKYLDEIIKEIKEQDVFASKALEYAKSTVLSGGKRLRPALMYYGYIGVGGKDTKKLIRASVGIELIHVFLLMHDDIMDNDNKRHGIDTIHYRYQKIGNKIFSGTDNEHFGNSIGILIGDMINVFGNRAIFNSGFDSKLILKAVLKMSSIISTTAVGQAEDIYIEYKKKATERDIMKMYTNKTAKYTIEGPLHMGVTLAGKKGKIFDEISDFSIPLGIAFQIQDDILGVFGDEKKLGKPVGSDIQEGKQTILVARALKHGNAKQKKAIESTLGKENLNSRDIENFRKAIVDSGSLDYAKKISQSYIEKSKKGIEKSSFSADAKEFLLAIADYMTKREV